MWGDHVATAGSDEIGSIVILQTHAAKQSRLLARFASHQRISINVDRMIGIIPEQPRRCSISSTVW